MRSVQKLVRNGNSTQITVKSQILTFVGWLPGDLVVVEVLEDKTLHVSSFDQHARNMKGMQPLLQLDSVEASR